MADNTKRSVEFEITLTNASPSAVIGPEDIDLENLDFLTIYPIGDGAGGMDAKTVEVNASPTDDFANDGCPINDGTGAQVTFDDNRLADVFMAPAFSYLQLKARNAPSTDLRFVVKGIDRSTSLVR